METHTHTVKDLMLNDTTFEIPIYQRKYSWKELDCEKLFEDIYNSMATEKPHFIGVVFLYTKNKGLLQVRDIIDGQQRIITLYLLFKAIYQHFESLGCGKSYGLSFYNRVFKDTQDELKIKLLESDQRAFEQIIFDSDVFDHKHKLIKNFYKFKKMLKEKITTENAEKFFRFVNKATACVISLDPRVDQDAQEIFESLNSKGEHLTQVDLLKNFLLMSLSDKELKSIFNKWKEIEEQIGVDLEKFVSNYIMYRTNAISPNPKKCYADLKKYLTENSISKIDAISDLYKHLNIFKYIRQTQLHPNFKIQKQLKRLNEVATSCYYSFALKVLSLFENKILSDESTSIILKYIECLIVRRSLIDSGGRSNHTLMWEMLTKKIKITSDKEKDIMTSIHYRIFNELKNENAGIGSDDQLKAAIINNVSYRSKTIIKFVLKSIEETENPNSIVNIDNLDIEHILPQKPKLPPEDQDEYNKYIHSLGNLTLTTKSKNSKMKNADFKTKKTIDYATSNMMLTKELSKLSNFDLSSIKTRTEHLAEKILKIWPAYTAPCTK